MTIHQSVELFVIINFIVMGLSHAIQPGIWIDFFKLLSSKGQAGNVANSLLAISAGSIITSFHWVWEGTMMIVTIYGVLLLIKATLFLLIPKLGLKSISQLDENRKKLYGVGIVMVLIGLFLAYNLYIDLITTDCFGL